MYIQDFYLTSTFKMKELNTRHIRHINFFIYNLQFKVVRFQKEFTFNHQFNQLTNLFLIVFGSASGKKNYHLTLAFDDVRLFSYNAN